MAVDRNINVLGGGNGYQRGGSKIRGAGAEIRQDPAQFNPCM